MKYITGMHALNMRCQLNTSGDWHRGLLDWDNPEMMDTENHPLGEWGIEKYKETYKANHLRAVLDMMLDKKNLPHLISFYSDWISNPIYYTELLEKVKSLSYLPHYIDILDIMKRNKVRTVARREKLGKLQRPRRTS